MGKLCHQKVPLTVIDPRQRGCPQAAAVVVEGVAVPIQGMVEVGIIPVMRTEILTGWEGLRDLKGTILFSTCTKRGLEQMGSICYVN